MIRAMLFSLAVLLMSACSTLDVQSDYNPEFDFSRLKRFAVVSPTHDGIRSLTSERITRALQETLSEKGYDNVPKAEADFLLLFHTRVTDKREIVTDYQNVGLYPYYYWPMMVPVQREYHYTESKIIIDALDPDGNTIFWRSVATDELDTFKTPQERIDYLQNVITEALKSFPRRR